MQLTQVSETSFDSIRVDKHIICRFKNDLVRKKKMAAEDQAVILCFTVVWFWRRRAQDVVCPVLSRLPEVLRTTPIAILGPFNRCGLLVEPYIKS